MCANYLTLNNRTGILFTINMLQSLNDLKKYFRTKSFFFMCDNQENFRYALSGPQNLKKANNRD